MMRMHLRRVHFLTGLLSLAAFLTTGQFMRFHTPPLPSLSPELRMMYLSRHIYLLGAALVNVALGLYLELRPEALRRALQQIGSLLIAVAPALLLMAFFVEPAQGIASRRWRSHVGLYALFGGMMLHLIAAVRTRSSGKPS